MDVDIEGLAVAVDRDTELADAASDGVEDLAAYPVHTHHGGSLLGGRVRRVCRARDRDPVGGALNIIIVCTFVFETFAIPRDQQRCRVLETLQ